MAQTQKAISGRPYSVDVSERDLALCGVKARYASELTREETQALMNWCDWQDESLWDGMSLQEILNVYRVSAKYVSWQEWASESRAAAHGAWNRVVSVANFMRD